MKNNKIIVYTSNLRTSPRNMADVIEFAKTEPKFYIASVALSQSLADVKAGDLVITKKGNSAYILRAFTEELENLSFEDRTYLEKIKREYGAKNVNITGVSQIVRFETWCKSAKPLITETNNNVKATNMKNSIKGFGERLREMYTPKEVSDVRISLNGELCVATDSGYVTIDKNNELISYPEEMTISGLPVFVMSKPATQLTAGDVIATGRGYAKVTKIDGQKITAIGYTGAGKTIHTIKDFLFNQTMVRVVVSLAGNLENMFGGGQNINPLLLMAMADDKKSSNLLPLMLMNQAGGAVGMNPMMLALLSDKGGDGFDMKDLLLMSSIGLGGFGGNIFGQPVQAAEPKSKPVKDEPESEPEQAAE